MSAGEVAAPGSAAGDSANRHPVALATVLGVLFLTFLDTTIVSVTLGSVQKSFGAGVISLQWVVNAYALVFASLMLLCGSLSDRFGRKTVMLGGIAVFCAGSLLAATAPNVGTLIAGRAVMGVGAAASEPGTLSMIRQLYPDAGRRARALGAWAAVSGLALASGPVIGGLLVAAGDWRAVFWFSLGAGLVLLAAASAVLPNSADPQPGRLDLRGFVLGTAALGATIFAVIIGEQHGFGSAPVVALFVLGGISLLLFGPVELRERSPMLDLHYMRAPTIGSALFMAFAVYFGVFSIFFFTALYLDVAVGYSGLKLAALFTPMAIAIVGGSLFSGSWVARAGSRWPMVVGSVIGAAGILLTRPVLDVDPAFRSLSITLAIAGLGFGIAVVPLTSAVLGTMPAAMSGMAASATNTARQIGAVVGVAALGALVNAHLTSDLSDRLTRLGIGGGARDLIINAVESGGSGDGFDIAHPPAIFAPIVDQATAAFRTGLHQALLASALLMLLAAVITSVAARRPSEG
ncbi:MAG TPA: MFS transporter [Jatrophihabitantaceae bacterium]|nr:MFS transporter [Jatrophihabitantaceae bacterium]